MIHHGSRIESFDDDVRVIFDRVMPSTRGLEAWVEVRWQGNAPSPQLIHFGRYDLMGSRTVGSLTSACEKFAVERNWRERFTKDCYYVINAHLEGRPLERLADVTQPEGPAWVVKPLVGGVGATSLVAPGGSTKSLMALAVAASVASGRAFLNLPPKVHGPVLYLDWEADAETHALRLEQLCLGVGIPKPDVLYRAEAGPLYRIAASVARQVSEEGVVLLVVDSVMLARGGDAFTSEATTAMYGALREIGVPSLLIDHKSREAQRKGWKGAYGSVVNDNSARLQWEITVTREHDDEVDIRLEATKRNNVGKQDPLAFRVEFGDAIRFHTISPVVVKEMPPQEQPLSEVILALLAVAGGRGLSNPDIVEQTGKSDATVRARLNDLKNRHLVKKMGTQWVSSEYLDALPEAF